MSKQCIFCESNTDLNTEMTIKLDDGTKAVVYICDTHAEDATAKSCKEKYVARQNQINEFLEQAKKLGLNVQIVDGLSVVKGPEKEPDNRMQQSREKHSDVEEQIKTVKSSAGLSDDDPNVVPTERLDRGMTSVGGSVDGYGVASYNNYTINTLADKDGNTLSLDVRKGKAKLAVVEGREGQPVVIPTKRVDGTGVTRINVAKNENDVTLQSRFKKMAQRSQTDGVVYGRDGYTDTRKCPICYGECFIIQNGEEQPCPKCKGAGFIAIV